jgi:hypothetical protein
MRRAQAAMEYLITYGWAVLIMLVVVGVLFYLGIFNPHTIATCSFQSPGFTCYVYKLAANNSVGAIQESGLILDLGQATGHDIKITGINCTASSDTFLVYDFNGTTMGNQNITVPSGSHKMVNGTSTYPGAIKCWKSDGTAMASGDLGTFYKGKIYIHYYDVETNIDHKVTGDISGKIE